MLLRIEPGSGVPISRQIADQVRLLCANRTLAAGDRLPSVRELAREISVNPNTVLRVYEQLTHEGLLERRHGSGTFVADGQPADQRKRQMASLKRELEAVVHRAGELGIDPDKLHELLEDALGRGGPSWHKRKGDAR